MWLLIFVPPVVLFIAALLATLAEVLRLPFRGESHPGVATPEAGERVTVPG